jgi:hypothetical protein
VTPGVKRAVAHVHEHHGLSERPAWEWVGVSRRWCAISQRDRTMLRCGLGCGSWRRSAGKPVTVVCDNGTRAYCVDHPTMIAIAAGRVALHRAGKSTQNGFVETFDRRLRNECLNETLITSIAHARFSQPS